MKDISGLNHPIYFESEKNQSKLIPQLLTEGESGLATLMDWMISLKQSNSLSRQKY